MSIPLVAQEATANAVARRTPRDDAHTEVWANQDGQTPWGSFHLATVMFQRARQLRNGSRPRVQPNGHKALRIALLEVTAGSIPWLVQGETDEIPPQS